MVSNKLHKTQYHIIMYKNIWLTAFLSLVVATGVMAHTPDLGKRSTGRVPVTPRGFCAASTSQIDQEINNVRARLLGGGDCWWDFNDGRYVVPKVDPTSGQREVSSIFAASVWLGGVDPVGNLKLACQDYRSGGRNDFWPGPLDPISGTTTEDVCKNWDKHFRVLGDEIRQHLSNLSAGITDPNAIPRGVKGWPARGNPYFVDVHQFTLPNTQQGLAGFFDADGDDLYDPLKGDYPSIEIRGCALDRYPSEMIFWIYNDEGSNSVHGRTGGNPIQMEVQVQAFGYQTSDELNDMTFQRYKLINRATEVIDSTFFAMWVDPDLGCYTDDYIGCDTLTSLMFCYNQDAADGQPGCSCPSGGGEVPTYCNEVPIIGVDYFRGPLRPAVIDDWQNPGQPKDTLIEIGMSSFIYYNNPGVGTPPPATTDPQLPNEFYNYLNGSWRDGTRLTRLGAGYDPLSTDFTKYALPASPDDPNGWSMCTANLPFGDRRTLQASGPFRLDPGAVNELIVGVPWVADADYPCPDIEQLLRADKLAQGLFDNCFERLEGPDAPTVNWIELNKQLVAVLTNEDVVSNNKDESYEQVDFLAPNDIRFSPDPAVRELAKYKFEGYKIYQLINPNVAIKDFENPDVARLVYQVDKKNGINKVFNWEETIDPADPTNDKKKFFYPVEKVDGSDAGIRHTFSITEDQFGTGNIRTLVNHKKYYFAVVAYAHNNYADFDFDDSPSTKTVGQQNPYLEGGRVEIKTVIPRPIVDRALNASYGDGAEVTRLEGQGAGGAFLEVKPESREAMLDANYNGEVSYENGRGPINITIFNPFEVKNGDFELEFIDGNLSDNTLDADAHWVLYKLDNGTRTLVDTSLTGINEINEQVFADYGFSLSIGQTPETGNLTPAIRLGTVETPGKSNGAIGAEWVYSDPNNEWLTGIPDQTSGTLFNYVQTGLNEPDYVLDPEQQLSQMGDGIFVPYPIISGNLPEGGNAIFTPGWTGKVGGSYYNRTALGPDDPALPNNIYQKLNLAPNVDIVFTSDRSKWSRCVVIETASEYYTGTVPGIVKDPTLVTEGSTPSRPRQSFDSRGARSVSKEDANNDGVADVEQNAVEPDSLPDPTAANPRQKRANPIKGQPLTGMGWFPGYAVNVETGQRLNIFFGENSCYSSTLNSAYTGRDMTWNPTDQFLRDEQNVSNIFDFMLGGQHWVYVSNTPYDECEYLRSRFNPDYWTSAPLKNLRKREGIAQLAWAGMVLPPQGSALKSLSEGLIPNELVVKLRVQNPYQVAVNQGNGHPKYRFSIKGRAADELTEVEVEDALDSIKVVPNPYYAFSQYEVNTASNLVKITNLPAKCVVTIYSLDGRFIRQYKRDEVYTPYNQITPALEWDIKNHKGIPVASGVYLIHINAFELGERTIKWFGVPRAFDPSGL